MSLVDYGSSSEEEEKDVEMMIDDDDKKPEKPPPPVYSAAASSSLPPPPPLHAVGHNNANSTSLSHPPDNGVSPLPTPQLEKLPDASVLFSSSPFPSHQAITTDHSSRVASATAANESRKRESNGSGSALPPHKLPRGALRHLRSMPNTGGGQLIPPQLRGSAFDQHLGHTLTNEDADKLMKSKWKYNLEMLAIDMPLSKWVGTGQILSAEVTSELVHGIKPKLYNHWLDFFKASSFTDWDARLKFFFSLCNTYRDIMHCNKKPFYLKGQEDSLIMDAYLMHAINHVFKTRDLVSKNNAKVTREEQGKEGEILEGSRFLDHGFTRPKVMFLLPLGSIALRVVKRLIQLIPASNRTNVDHIDHFYKEFGADDTEDDESSQTRKPSKPKDFERLFGGNNNDHFMIGIKLTKRSIKLFNDFYSSDIIVASPLGLVTKIGEAEAEKEKDVDYLSSIEVLIIDHADVIAMQNWSHLNTVVEQLNRTPSRQHGTDVMRIRQWYLDGNARFYRQTIVLSSFLNPDMNALFNRSCVNYEGKVRLVSEHKGVLPKVLIQVKQVYDRFDATSIAGVDDARIEFFSKKVFPRINESDEGGIMIFISSYFEYVRLRNFLTAQNASFCVIGDYAEPGDISRARVWFFEGKRKIMLYTERAHFYHRYKIRGIKKLFIYSLPERKEFYPEIINMIQEADNMVCNVLFSRFDHIRLERIVGTSAAKRMVSSDKKMFVFC